MFTPDRALHSLEVAKQMYEKAIEETNDKLYAQKMFHLGLIHDIGYQFTDNKEDHPHIGGNILRHENYEFWKEVYQHGDPKVNNPSKELNLLNYADMHTDSKGNRVSFEKRLIDIKNRYGVSSKEYINASKIINDLKM